MIEPIDPKREFRDLLALSGWSQAEAARQLAMTPSALSQIVRENSPVKPSPGTIRLFKLLLISHQPPISPPVEKRVYLTEKWEVDLITALRQIPPATRDLALKVVAPFTETRAKRRRKL